jgi:hypothetical protein
MTGRKSRLLGVVLKSRALGFQGGTSDIQSAVHSQFDVGLLPLLIVGGARFRSLTADYRVL